MVAHDARRAGRPAPQARRPHRAACRRTRRPGGRELRQAEARRAARRDAGDRRRLPLLCRRLPRDNRIRRRRISPRLYLDDPPRSDRRGRLHRAVELPADDGRLEARSGACRRQYGGDQALRADAADDAPACRARRRYPAGRRAERRRGPRRHHRRRTDQPPEGRDALADRQHRHRPQGPGGRLAIAEAYPPRAWRQGAGHRLRRCRHRRRGRGRAHVRLLQCRAGLHRRLPHLCRRGRL